MAELLGSVWWLIVSLGVLVTIHEYGHYRVARWCGVKVLRFSVGFGKPLWMRRGRDGTEYAIAAIPLGGYVRMLDEREADVDSAELDQAFNRKPVWQRIAIVAAGPAANLGLCVALFWAMFVVGRPDYAPVVGQVDRIAAEAGLQPGDTILAVGDRATPTWSEVQMALLPAALDRDDMALQVENAEGHARTRILPLGRLPENFNQRNPTGEIGLTPRHALMPAVIGRVEPDSAAWGVLAEGDRITAIDGSPIRGWNDIGREVQSLGARNESAMIEVERDGERLALEIKPRLTTSPDGNEYWALGVNSPSGREIPKDAVLRHGPLRAVPAAFAETGHQARQLFAMVGRAFTGRIAIENTVAGPVTIARATNAFAGQGLAWYLSILALLSLSLGILNLLPIPILDGGHLLYYLIELVKGSPVSERVMAAGQYVGLALIVGLMGLAFYNDIVNNLVR
ncbi:RIP metalloprotease RseP [Marilutibacter alkalisoli]|uniref:Zinc metalloprotease n=1 Tax=Marilutibacter alkalisoli TaxID=2591633 RepID=A0A514BTD5_9GAMM|nr:RIP metalloprotease RseP [Lysobacter alkalisoli]QDH70636.1 RIP metalloprotease RseP [Lysobacter alkalisoli]